jgi:hypothetical protein
VSVNRYEGLIHGFFILTGVFDHAKQAVGEVAAKIRALKA